MKSRKDISGFGLFMVYLLTYCFLFGSAFCIALLYPNSLFNNLPLWKQIFLLVPMAVFALGFSMWITIQIMDTLLSMFGYKNKRGNRK